MSPSKIRFTHTGSKVGQFRRVPRHGLVFLRWLEFSPWSLLFLGLLDATRKTFDRVRLVMAKLVQYARRTARLGVDRSGQSRDAVDIAAAIGKAVAKRLLNALAVAFDGFGQRIVADKFPLSS